VNAENPEAKPPGKNLLRQAVVFLSPSIVCLLTRFLLSSRAIRIQPYHKKLLLPNPPWPEITYALNAGFLSLILGGATLFIAAVYFGRTLKMKDDSTPLLFLSMLIIINLGVTFGGCSIGEQLLLNYENSAAQPAR